MWLCACTTVRDENVHGLHIPACYECGYARPDLSQIQESTTIEEVTKQGEVETQQQESRAALLPGEEERARAAVSVFPIGG